MSDVTLKDIEALINSGKLSESDLRVLEAQLIKLEKLKERELCQTKFIKFVEKCGRASFLVATTREWPRRSSEWPMAGAND